MASHIDTKLERQTTGKKMGPKRKYVAAPIPQPKNALDAAIAQERTPTHEELLLEIRCAIGTTLIQLRQSVEPHKKANAISQLVRAVCGARTAEKISELEDDVIATMTDNELKDYLLSSLDKLK